MQYFVDLHKNKSIAVKFRVNKNVQRGMMQAFIYLFIYLFIDFIIQFIIYLAIHLLIYLFIYLLGMYDYAIHQKQQQHYTPVTKIPYASGNFTRVCKCAQHNNTTGVAYTLMFLRCVHME